MESIKNMLSNCWGAGTFICRLVICAMVVITAAMLLASCEDFLEVDLPNSQANADDVFEEKTTAHAAMTDVYSRIRDYGLLTGTFDGLTFSLGLYADEMNYYGTPDSGPALFYSNSLIANYSQVRSLFNTTYGQLYACNAIVEGINGSQNLPAADKDRILGEALFTRALLHFYLAGVFGDIPYIKTTDYSQNSHVSRLPVSEVYALCAQDLELALGLLPADYLTPSRTRPNRFVAHALLAKVALVTGDYGIAENEASAVINESALYQNVQDLSQTFLKESTGTIWQLSTGNSGFNTHEATVLIFETGPPPYAALSQNLIASFTSGDLRVQNWTRAITNGSETLHHAYKYKALFESETENSIVLRLADMYLVRAEARARLGELTTAKEDLNVIRNLAGIGDTPAVSQQEILADILLQNRLEFFCEHGHRFFDLKRQGMLDQVLSLTKPGWESTDALFPIPEAEILINPALLPQNPGY